MNVTTLRESSYNDTGAAGINLYTGCYRIKIYIMRKQCESTEGGIRRG